MNRYLKILWMLSKISLIEQTTYRYSFYMAIFGKVFRIALLLIFFNALYSHVPTIGGWDFESTILLIGIFGLVEFIGGMTIRRNLAYYFPDQIKDGSFDKILTLPTKPLFWASIRSIDLMDGISLIPVLGLLIYGFSINQISLDFASVVFFILLLISALTSLFALYIIIGTLSFWTVIGGGPGRMMDGFMMISRVPATVYTGFAKLIFIYVLPIAIIATIPTQLLLHTLTPALALYSLLLSAILIVVALKFWHIGLAQYTSAGG